MKILFLHRNFPGQFKYLAMELAQDVNNEVCFITNNNTTRTTARIRKIVYKLKRKVPKDCHRYLRFYEDAIIHGQAVAEVLIQMKTQGYKPDIIYGHTWGCTLFVKDIFPDVPLVCYFEWFYNPEGADVGFNGEYVGVDTRAKLQCKNSHLLLDLLNCDFGISPTEWQKAQFPKEFQNKIEVLHEGIDTNICCPKDNAIFEFNGKRFTKEDEILTYATRGMEEYRGFPEFMKTVEQLQKIRPNMQVIIGGEDRVCYGCHLKNDTFKQKMLRELDLDLSRIHFVGNLPYAEYIKLLQVSRCHVYLTYPFVLSWSLLEAMATGCCIVASDTAPVKEVIQNNFNGILVDFYDIDLLVKNVNLILNNPENFSNIRTSARKTINEKFELKNLLNKQIEFLYNCKVLQLYA